MTVGHDCTVAGTLLEALAELPERRTLQSKLPQLHTRVAKL